MPREHFFAVDRVHENDAVIMDDTGRALTIPLDRLPTGVAARTVLRVSIDNEGNPHWSTAKIDEAETQRRKQAAGDLLNKLRRSDAHGFINPEE